MERATTTKSPKLTLVLGALLSFSYPLHATQWEFAMRVLTADGLLQAGYHTITWNARNAATGSYVARIVVFDALGKEVYTKTSKLVLMK